MRARWLGLVWLAARGPRDEPCAAARYPPQADSSYLLPYPVGQTYNVRQGNCNVNNTHNDAHNASFAYDFEMPLGAPVTAG